MKQKPCGQRLLASSQNQLHPLAGVARNSRDSSIPWLIENDKQLFIMVEGTGEKRSMRMSQVARNSCQSRGITELTVMDHNLVPRMKDTTNV